MRGFIFVLFLLIGMSAFAQGKATAEFKVEGCCGMCADRIEGALDVSGVRLAEWSREDKAVFVVYKPKKISSEDMEQLVADSGHDTEHVRADDAVYASLAECCQYRDGCSGCSDDHDQNGYGDEDDERAP